MIDVQSLPLQADQARAARNYFGLSQAKAAEACSLPLHKIKRFEAGNYIPDTEFLEDLRAFYEDRGFDFNDTPAPGAKAKESGSVFPAGVIGNQQPSPSSVPIGRPQKASFHHMRVALPEPQMSEALDLIDANEQKVEALLSEPLAPGFLSDLTDASEARHVEALKLLAENGALFARLFGREIGGTPKPALLAGKEKPRSQADLLHRSHADAHLAIEGSRDAKARHQARKPAKTIMGALFG